MILKMKFYVIILLVFFKNCACGPVNYKPPEHYTSIVTQNTTVGKIEYKLIDKPHHLFVGRCLPDNKFILHQENIIVKNDGKSHVSAAIKTNIDGPVKIACVKIFDEVPNGEGGYPKFVSGGVGYNYIEFNVVTVFGKGFHFFMQIYGFNNKKE